MKYRSVEKVHFKKFPVFTLAGDGCVPCSHLAGGHHLSARLSASRRDTPPAGKPPGPILLHISIEDLTALRIRDVYPESDFFRPGSELFPSRIRIEEFKYFKPKKLYLSSREYDLGCSSRIRILIFYPSRISGSKGTGSRIRIRNIGRLD